MILAWVIIILLAGGVAAWVVGHWSPLACRLTSVVTLLTGLLLMLILWGESYQGLRLSGVGWLAQVNWPWIPSLGISFHLAMDGLSLLLMLLTLFLGLLAVMVSWVEITERVGFFHFNLLCVLAGIAGVFVAMDLFLFYFFWELMLVPMAFLILLWGHENRVYAAIKFFIFTQVSGLLMLVAIVALFFIHGRLSGVYTFDYRQLLGTPLSSTASWWLMLGFLAAFLVKLPALPFHTWLPDAHTEAPTAGSLILAGLLLKTGAYGLLRFVVPLFPEASLGLAPYAMALGVAGILYGAMMAFAQTDLKRLVAYTSVSHMGFVLLGVFAFNELALQGVIMEMLAHGISTGALFVVVGQLQERTHTRDMERLGGLWEVAPRMGGVALFFALASLGLPGLGNFIAEFLVLAGSFKASVPLASLAALGLVGSTIYSLWLIQRTFQGPNRERWKIADLSGREMLVMGLMILSLLGLGLYPQPVLNTARPSLVEVQRRVVALQSTAWLDKGAIP